MLSETTLIVLGWVSLGFLGSIIEIIICPKEDRSIKTYLKLLAMSVFGPWNLMTATEHQQRK
jgi:hypothetical protein